MDYYLDFDYTLFNTYSFREDLYKILENNGFDKTHLALTPETKNNNQQLLNIKEKFKELAISHNISMEKFLNPLEELYKKGSTYLYEDAIDFLKYLKSKNNRIHILTWGDKNYQQEKIEITNISDYVDDIIYAESLKYGLDINYENAIFIDDSIRDIEGLNKKKANQIFRIKRPNGKNSDKELNINEVIEFASLKELQEYLENMKS